MALSEAREMALRPSNSGLVSINNREKCDIGYVGETLEAAGDVTDSFPETG
jgi:hypothetical protein